jgi:hypothetical protein
MVGAWYSERLGSFPHSRGIGLFLHTRLFVVTNQPYPTLRQAVEEKGAGVPMEDVEGVAQMRQFGL